MSDNPIIFWVLQIDHAEFSGIKIIGSICPPDYVIMGAKYVRILQLVGAKPERMVVHLF